jgi:NAD(P)-dependent dehydrogenase (short-subunit alcohol dehydrogenase family)
VAGFYPNPGLPQYVAAKHGVIGLVRSLAPVAGLHNITINALCPAFVATNLDTSLSKWFPEKLMTPMSLILRGFDELMDETLGYNGETVEGCTEGLFYRKAIEPVAPSMKELANCDGMRLWVEECIKRNRENTRKRLGAAK